MVSCCVVFIHTDIIYGFSILIGIVKNKVFVFIIKYKRNYLV